MKTDVIWYAMMIIGAIIVLVNEASAFARLIKNITQRLSGTKGFLRTRRGKWNSAIPYGRGEQSSTAMKKIDGR